MIKQAMVLSAGFGKRVRPLTLKKPKSLLDLGNQTLLSNTLKFLSNHGVEKVVINVHYLADQIIEYVSKNKFNLEIIISNEKNTLAPPAIDIVLNPTVEELVDNLNLVRPSDSLI